MAISEKLKQVLDGDGYVSPLGVLARELTLGTVLDGIHTRLGDLDGGSDTGTITADVIAEETPGAGVTPDGLNIKDGSVRPAIVTDPGASGAIPVTHSGVCPITTAGSETRTLAIPTFLGQWLVLCIDVDGGTCVITSAQAINQTGNNTITMADAADTISLVAVRIAGVLRWRVMANDGAALTTV